MKRNPKDPFDAIQEIRARMNELFEESLRGASAGRKDVSDSKGAVELPVDMVEKDDHYLVVLELPGVQKKDIDIQLVGNELVIRGEKAHDAVLAVSVYHMAERLYGPFHRRIRLPEPVKENAVSTNLENGLLEISIKKSQPRQIPIK